MPNETTWTYTLTPRGSVEHECWVTLVGNKLRWDAKPTDPEKVPTAPDCEQPVAEFREFGPPEFPAYLEMPPRILDAVCEALGLVDPAWRQPVTPDLADWFAAVDRGDLNRMTTWLSRGTDINAVDGQRRSALWHAADMDDRIVTRWLLERGADTESRDRYGNTVLMAAAWRRREELAEVYLEFGADKTVRNSSGYAPWVQAVMAKAGGMLINSLRTTDPEDWNHALHQAAWGSNAAWLEGETWWADLHHSDVNAGFGEYQLTPLQGCLVMADPSPIAVRWLVEHGADLAVVNGRDGTTMVHYAARYNFPWLIEPSIRAGVPVDARDADGETALSIALNTNECPILVKALLDAGADPAARVSVRGPDARPGGETVLEKARRKKLLWSVMLLENDVPAMRTWPGLCAYARLDPEHVTYAKSEPSPDTLWVEFPADWLGPSRTAMTRRLRSVAEFFLQTKFAEPVLLSQEQALKQPWSWPGRKLWAMFPNTYAEPVVRFRDQRPRAMISDPAAWVEGGLAELRREWRWPAVDWNGRWENCSVFLQNGMFIWSGSNTRVEQPIDRFRVEGPPAGAGFHRSLPRVMLDEICALIAETQRMWELPTSEPVRKERIERWTREQRPAPVTKPKRQPTSNL